VARRRRGPRRVTRPWRSSTAWTVLMARQDWCAPLPLRRPSPVEARSRTGICSHRLVIAQQVSGEAGTTLALRVFEVAAVAARPPRRHSRALPRDTATSSSSGPTPEDAARGGEPCRWLCRCSESRRDAGGALSPVSSAQVLLRHGRLTHRHVGIEHFWEAHRTSDLPYGTFAQMRRRYKLWASPRQNSPESNGRTRWRSCPVIEPADRHRRLHGLPG